MAKYITFGNWNKSYFYIIASFTSMVAFNAVEGFGYYFYSLQLSDDKFNGHIYIHKLCYYLLILICSLLYSVYKNMRDKKNLDKRNAKNVDELAIYKNIELIHTDTDTDEYINKNISNIYVLGIIFLYVLFDHIDTIVRQYFAFADFWMVELWIMAYLCKKMLKTKIYIHQLIGIYSAFIPFLLKATTITLFFFDENNYLENGQINYKYNNDKENTLAKSLFVAHTWLFPISFISYFIVMVIESYIVISIKKIMDLNMFRFQKY